MRNVFYFYDTCTNIRTNMYRGYKQKEKIRVKCELNKITENCGRNLENIFQN